MTITMELLNKDFECIVCNKSAELYVITFIGMTYVSCKECYKHVIDSILPNDEFKIKKFSCFSIFGGEAQNILTGALACLYYDEETKLWNIPVRSFTSAGNKYITLSELKKHVNYMPIISIDLSFYNNILKDIKDINLLKKLNGKLIFDCIFADFRMRCLLHGIIYEKNSIVHNIPMNIYYYIFENFF